MSASWSRRAVGDQLEPRWTPGGRRQSHTTMRPARTQPSRRDRRAQAVVGAGTHRVDEALASQQSDDQTAQRSVTRRGTRRAIDDVDRPSPEVGERSVDVAPPRRDLVGVGAQRERGVRAATATHAVEHARRAWARGCAGQSAIAAMPAMPTPSAHPSSRPPNWPAGAGTITASTYASVAACWPTAHGPPSTATNTATNPTTAIPIAAAIVVCERSVPIREEHAPGSHKSEICRKASRRRSAEVREDERHEGPEGDEQRQRLVAQHLHGECEQRRGHDGGTHRLTEIQLPGVVQHPSVPAEPHGGGS